MRAPLSWLQEFAPFSDDVATLRDALDDLGLVVEGIAHVGEGLGDVVVARIDEIRAIEGARSVRLVIVDAGDGPLEIVCGATNFEVGNHVPLAPVGAVLPGDFAIARRKLAGVVSNGMLCSARELELADDHEGLMLLDDEGPLVPGQRLVELLDISPDVVFDLAVEGNRPDAWCIAGIARDLASRLQLPFSPPTSPPANWSAKATSEVASVVVEATELCPIIEVAVATGISVTPSPRWLQRRLTLAGMRPINNVVDASNYVMLEWGQPTHPYDHRKVSGGGLLVRQAVPGETLETLDGTTRTLGQQGAGLGDDSVDCVICDANGAPVGIAGIMGGASSEITNETTDLLLEVASFAAMPIARSSKKLGLRTEASARFERGCDPSGLDRAAMRFFALLALTSPDLKVCTAPLVVGSEPAPVILTVNAGDLATFLGLSLDGSRVRELLGPLGFDVSNTGDELMVTVPLNRPDIRPMPFGVADLAEEVARTAGYASVPRTFPSWSAPGGLEPRQTLRRLLRQVMVGMGINEAWTPTLTSAADAELLGITAPAVTLANPLSAEESHLRQGLLAGLVRALAYNADRRQGDVALFETGTVFIHPDVAANPRHVKSGAGGKSLAVLPQETERLTVVFGHDGDDARVAVAGLDVLISALRLEGITIVQPDDTSDLDGLFAGMHPTRTALVIAPTGVIVGVVGELDPDVARRAGLSPSDRRVGVIDLSLDLLADETAVPRRADAQRLLSRFPSTDFDLAFVLGSTTPASTLTGLLRTHAGPECESVTLFDVFAGPGIDEGSRSLAYRLRFCAMDRTLTDEEVGVIRASLIEAASSIGAVLR